MRPHLPLELFAVAVGADGIPFSQHAATFSRLSHVFQVSFTVDTRMTVATR